MRERIRLDTASDLARFVLAVNRVPKDVKVYVKNKDGSLSIDGKSFLGLAHAKEFEELYCVCERDIYSMIQEFVVTGG